MAPTFKLVATIISPHGQLITDCVTIAVNSLNRYKVNMTLVQLRDHSKQTVQVVTRTIPGSFVGVSLLRSGNYFYQTDSEVTHSRFLKSLYELEPFNRSVHRVTWTDRQGQQPERVQYLTASNPAGDTKRTFSLAGLVVFTDAAISQKPELGIKEFSYQIYDSMNTILDYEKLSVSTVTNPVGPLVAITRVNDVMVN